MTFVIGLDWGGAAHAVCVLDRGSGAVVDRFEARHDAGGLRDMARRLARHGAPGDLPVAVERPSGLIVDALVAAGHPVIPIHPNAVKASRPRYRASGAKDDRGDAYLLADLLRTDGHRFRPLTPPSDALRSLTRGRDDLVATRVQLANQLRSLLERFWPGAALTFADIDSPIALAFLERYPTPCSAARLGVRRLASFLAQHRYSGRRSPDELLARLRAAPQSHAGSTETAAGGEMVRALVAILVPLGLGCGSLSTRPRPRMQAPTRHTHPRPRMASRSLARVAGPKTIQSSHTSRRRHYGLTQAVSCDGSRQRALNDPGICPALDEGGA